MVQKRYIWQTLIRFIFVVRHWREYYSIVHEMFHPWFDVEEGAEALYMSDPENWRCKFCGSHYYYRREGPPLHRPDCIWSRITKLRQDGGF